MHREGHLKAQQIRAARALLDWSQDDLAKAAKLSVATIRTLELGHVSPRGTTNRHIWHAFEDAGLEFIEPNGVRQKPEEITVYQGLEGLKDFFDEVYQTSYRTGAEVVQVWPSARQIIDMMGEYRNLHAARMIAAQDRIKVKCVLTEDQTCLPSPYCEYRFLSRHFVDSVPFYVYADKYAIVSFSSNEEYKIIVIQSRAAANSFRRQFDSMWQKASMLHNPNTKEIKAKTNLKKKNK